MQGVASKRAKINHSSIPAYRNRLSFYKIPPEEEIVLDEFDSFAMDRLKVLQDIDAARNKGLKGDDFNNRIREVVRKYLPLREHNEEDIRKDVISHFLLRLAYCRTNEDRRWFIAQEKGLMKFRLEDGNLSEFLAENDLQYKCITKQEFAKFETSLRQVIESGEKTSGGILDYSQFFKVPFEEASDLIMQRRVFLHRGEAYVFKDNLISIVLGRFRAHISQTLVTAHKALASLSDTYAKIGPRLESFSKQYTGVDYTKYGQVAGSVTLDQIDYLAKRSFPMCMNMMHHHLRKQHHLKHMGRMQFGLFLKGIGLSMEDALAFWRSEMAKNIGVDKFEKQYAYNIRHNYGKEGNRKNYTPYSCLKIIESPAPAGVSEQHGCPYKQELSALVSELKKMNITGVDQIVEIVKRGHHQIACAKHFELMHPGSMEVVIMHPNQYFDESMKFHNYHGNNVPQTSSSSSSSTTAAAAAVPTTTTTTTSDVTMKDA